MEFSAKTWNRCFPIYIGNPIPTVGVAFNTGKNRHPFAIIARLRVSFMLSPVPRARVPADSDPKLSREEVYREPAGVKSGTKGISSAELDIEFEFIRVPNRFPGNFWVIQSPPVCRQWKKEGRCVQTYK